MLVSMKADYPLNASEMLPAGRMLEVSDTLGAQLVSAGLADHAVAAVAAAEGPVYASKGALTDADGTPILSGSEMSSLKSMGGGSWNDGQRDAINAGGGLVVADAEGHLTGPGGAIVGGGSGVAVVDALTSSSTASALSANQGRVLKTLIDALSTTTPTRYPEVNNFASLPATAADSDTYVVLQSSGVYFINRKPAGLYRYSGGQWIYLGEVPNGYFTDNSLRFFDNDDATKQLAFELSSITPGTTRTLTAPDKSGVLALLSDIADKQDALVSGVNIGTVAGQSLLGPGDIPKAVLMRGAPTGVQISGNSLVKPYFFSQMCLTYTSSSAILAGAINFYPFWVGGVLDIDRIGVRVTTAGTGTARLALYTADPTTSMPAALVVDSGDLDTSTTGDKEGVVLASLDAGLYWMAICVSAGCSVNGATNPGGNYLGQSGPITGVIRGLKATVPYAPYDPSAAPIDSVHTNLVYGIWVRES